MVRNPVRVQQTPVPIVDFGYRLGDFVDAEAYVGEACRIVAACECDVIGQVGTPFGWDGCVNEHGARARQERFARSAGVPVLTNTLAIVDALRALDARRITLAATYYDAPMRAGWSSFLGACGFEVLATASVVDQGLAGDTDDYMWDLTWSLTDDMVSRSIMACCETDPDADAVVVTGTAARTLALAGPAEERSGVAVVAADTALYWALMRHLALAPARRFSRLFALLD